jgi:hypothetical protein
VTQQSPTVTQPSNGLGTSGFVLGLIGLIFSPIPLVGVIAWPLVILGIIFSAIGISKVRAGRATNKGLSIAGLVVSVIGLVICIVWVVAINDAVDDINKEANKESTITYEVTGDVASVDVDYSTYGDAGVTSSQENVTTLPWTKDMKTKGFVKGGSLLVMADEVGGTVTCRVLIDGKEATTNTATGSFAVATCTGF